MKIKFVALLVTLGCLIPSSAFGADRSGQLTKETPFVWDGRHERLASYPIYSRPHRTGSIVPASWPPPLQWTPATPCTREPTLTCETILVEVPGTLPWNVQSVAKAEVVLDQFGTGTDVGVAAYFSNATGERVYPLGSCDKAGQNKEVLQFSGELGQIGTSTYWLIEVFYTVAIDSGYHGEIHLGWTLPSPNSYGPPC